jgi:hypothetical protein
VLSEVSWLAAVVFVALTGLAGLAGDGTPTPRHRATRRLLIGGALLLPAILLAGLLFTS